jgi:hypothetical protein
MQVRTSQFRVPPHQLRAAARLIALLMFFERMAMYLSRAEMLDALEPLYDGGRGARERKLRRDLVQLRSIGAFAPEEEDGFDTFAATPELWRIPADVAKRLAAALAFLPKVARDAAVAAGAACKVAVMVAGVAVRPRDLSAIALPPLATVVGRRGAGDGVPAEIAARVVLLKNAAWAAGLQGVLPLPVALGISGCPDRATLRALLAGLSREPWPLEPDLDDLGLMVDVDVSATKSSTIRRWRFSAAEALAIAPWLETMVSAGGELAGVAHALGRLFPPGTPLAPLPPQPLIAAP